VSSNVVSATLSAVASKVAVPVVVSPVHPVVVSPAPTATTYDEQHQLINDMKTGLIESNIIRLSPLLTTASLISIDCHYILLLVRVSIQHHYLLLLVQVSINHQYLLLLVQLSIQRHCLLLSQPHGRSYSCPWSHDVDI
jgi:hypothetical protein